LVSWAVCATLTSAVRFGHGHGFWAATTDEAKIRRWYTQHPHWQVAIRTGAVSELVVLDVDLDKGGLDSLINLERAGLIRSRPGQAVVTPSPSSAQSSSAGKTMRMPASRSAPRVAGTTPQPVRE